MSVVQMGKLRICESLAQVAKLGMKPVPSISVFGGWPHTSVLQISTRPARCPTQPDMLAPPTLITLLGAICDPQERTEVHRG